MSKTLSLNTVRARTKSQL